MKILKKKTLKSTNGITLIALVITIIVLLILAGISISMLSGDNGILQRATEAKEKTGTSQIDERVYLSVNSAIVNGLGTLNYNNLNSELESEFGQGNYTITPPNNAESWQVTVTANGITRNYNIKSTGEVKVASEGDDEPTGTLQLSFNTVPTESRAVILEATVGEEPTKAELQAKSEEELRPYVLSVYYNITNNDVTWSEIGSMIGIQDPTVHQVFLAVNSYISSRTGKTYEDEYDLIIKEEGYLEVATFTCNGETVNGTKGKFLITKNGNYTVTASKGQDIGSVTANVTNCVNRTDNQVETFEYPENRNQNHTLSQDGYEVVIPAGFAYGKSSNVGTVATGFVITDDIDENGNSIGNEFVWIPIDRTNLTVGKTNKKMAELSISSGKSNYIGVLYNWSMDSTGNTTHNGYYKDIYDDTEITMQNDYNAMIASIKQYGGFYVARYEMGDGEANISRLGVTPISAAEIEAKHWDGLYNIAKNYNKSNVTAEMIWGSQYDAMLNFALTNSADSAKVNQSTNGNHSGKLLKTGTWLGSNGEKDRINNIFDLEGNLYEYIQEETTVVNDNIVKVRRGGYFGFKGTPSYYNTFGNFDSSSSYSSRVSLYINID